MYRSLQFIMEQHRLKNYYERGEKIDPELAAFNDVNAARFNDNEKVLSFLQKISVMKPKSFSKDEKKAASAAQRTEYAD